MKITQRQSTIGILVLQAALALLMFASQLFSNAMLSTKLATGGGGLLMIGLVANLLVRPLNPKWFMTDAELAEEKRIAHEKSTAASAQLAGAAVRGSSDATPPIKVWLAWLAVGIPLAWGVYRTLLAAAKFFV